MIAIVAITEEGKTIAKRLNSSFSGKSRLYFPAKGFLEDLVGMVFNKDRFEGIVFIMALGIVVRLIIRHLKNKYRDPAVVVVDDQGRFAISLLSGHEGGANNLAIQVGNILGADPVITTASESQKKLVVGIGCKRGIKKEEIVRAIMYALTQVRYPANKVRGIASVDLKQNEAGLKNACLELGIPLKIVPAELIKNFNGVYQRSSFVKEKIGIEGVSEPCALIVARKAKLILPKIKVGRVTVAIAREA